MGLHESSLVEGHIYCPSEVNTLQCTEKWVHFGGPRGPQEYEEAIASNTGQDGGA